jgi:hypothetical protein
MRQARDEPTAVESDRPMDTRPKRGRLIKLKKSEKQGCAQAKPRKRVTKSAPRSTSPRKLREA